MPLLIIGFKGNRVISKISKDFVRHDGMLAHQEPLSILGENLLPLNTSITIETEKSAETAKVVFVHSAKFAFRCAKQCLDPPQETALSYFGLV